MPPIIQNKKTYIVSTQQLLAWKRIKDNNSRVIEVRDSNLLVDNDGIIETIYENGKSDQIESIAP